MEASEATGGPTLWCDEPPPDTETRVAGTVDVRGWCLPAGSVQLEVAVDGGAPVLPRLGLPRPDVGAAFPDEQGAAASGWHVRLETADWTSGSHTITVTATDASGRTATAERAVEVDRDEPYRRWLAARMPFLPVAADGAAAAEEEGAPEFLVTVLAADADTEAVARTEETLQAQLYPRWTSTVVAGGAAALDAAVRSFLDGTADYLVFARAGDLLEPHALLALARTAASEPAPQVIYADEDRLGAERHDPFFKPGWSPELLPAFDYVGPFAALDRSAAARSLEIDQAPPGSVYDLLLRLVDEDVEVDRIPDVLYTRTSVGPDEAAEVAALELLARRRGRGIEVSPAHGGRARHVVWSPDSEPKVSIVIATAFRSDLLLRCLDSIRERTTYGNFEVIVVANGIGDADPPPLELPGTGSRIVRYDGGFNYSAINNVGVQAATGDFLLFLNDDTEIITADWIEQLLSAAAAPRVGFSGAKLVHPGGLLQVAGTRVVDAEEAALVMGNYLPGSASGYHGLYDVIRNTTTVCGACMLVRRDVFDALRGFDEGLAIDLNDVDLGLRGLAAGWRTVWTPQAVVLHVDRASREERSNASDRARFRHRWASLLEAGDPHYNPNLDPDKLREFEICDLPLFNHRPVRGRIAPSARDLAPGERPSPERFDPLTMHGLIAAEHIARYQWAARLVAGKTVLDAGCGLGYGARLCAEAGAARVVGLDVSREALHRAASRVLGMVELVEGSLEDLPFDAGAFDIVLCFEAIEHVEDAGRAIDELKYVLRADGVLAISSPNRGVAPPGNPYHVHEFTAEELGAALAERFEHVRLYRQDAWLATLIADKAGSDDGGDGVRTTEPIEPDTEIYTLALASDAPLPDPGTQMVLTEPSEVMRLQTHVKWLEQQAMDAWAETERWRALAAEHGLALDEPPPAAD